MMEFCCHFPALTGLLLLTAVQRLPVYRSLRSYSLLFGIGFILYRSIWFNNSTSILTQLLSELSVLSKGYESVMFDTIGILIMLYIAGAVNKCFTAIIHIQSLDQLMKYVAQEGYGLVKNLSFVQGIIKKEVEKLEHSLELELKSKSRALGPVYVELPEQGLSSESILSLMDSATKKEDPVWMEGNVSGAVFHSKKDHIDLLNRSFNYYSMSNALFPAVWPSLMKFESEVVAMTAAMVSSGASGIVGCMTSGGSDSVILSIKAHRDFYCNKHGITEPELICGVSAHAAVDKACELMKIKLIKVKLDKNFRVDLNAIRGAITNNTIMLYASAPSYPHGAIDDIAGMARIAKEKDIGLHVDCCLGGFVLPFAKDLGLNIPEFDFALSGVTGMSVDAHKYGYSLKGASVVLYRHKALRHAQYFCSAEWTGGLFTTPTMAGSRSGGLIAQAWASMMALGKAGYREHSKEIITCTRKIAAGVREIQGLKLLGDAVAMIACFASDDSQVNIYSVGDEMRKKGWNLNAMQHPPCMHLCVTLTHLGREEKFLADLAESVSIVRSKPTKREGNAAIYGMTAALPPGPVEEILKAYNDVVLKV